MALFQFWMKSAVIDGVVSKKMCDSLFWKLLLKGDDYVGRRLRSSDLRHFVDDK